MSPLTLQLTDAMRPNLPSTLKLFATTEEGCGCSIKKKGSLKRGKGERVIVLRLLGNYVVVKDSGNPRCRYYVLFFLLFVRCLNIPLNFGNPRFTYCHMPYIFALFHLRLFGLKKKLQQVFRILCLRKCGEELPVKCSSHNKRVDFSLNITTDSCLSNANHWIIL